MKLDKHTAAVHKDKKPYKCANCNFSFASKESLDKHYNAMSFMKERSNISAAIVLLPSHAHGV